MIGTRLAHYEITAHLGSGGFGDVYQATDSKLGRSVALKLLPEEFAADADRLSRFRREAQVLASLSHPNIAAIHGFEDSAGRLFLVMELVDGETLQTRLKRGAIPVDEALTIAKQICEALETAHDKGVVHRDLKPGNVMLTSDGKVKVLDFGLAKVNDANSSNPSTSDSPTMASISATNAGIILGTAAYMSPEQARGLPVDKRADIWSFGVVLFEMLTGRGVFQGEDVSMTLSKVLQTEPDFATLPPSVPARVSQVLRVCLRKDSKQRAGDTRDVRLALEGAFESAALQATVRPIPRPRPLVARSLPWVLGAVAMSVALWAPWRVEKSVDRALVRLDVDLGADVAFPSGTTNYLSNLAISPDGTRLAYVSGNPSRLFIRRLDQAKASELAGTQGALQPFFSPDGEEVGFWANGKVNTISVEGGTVVPRGEVANFGGASWAEDGSIFASDAFGKGLQQLSAAGAPIKIIAPVGADESGLGNPQPLPGGKAILFSASTNTAGGADGKTIEVLTLADGHRKILVRGGQSPHYLPSSAGTGYLLYINKATLFAIPFDLATLTTRGTAVAVLDDVASSVTTGAGQFDISRSGTFNYRRASGVTAATATLQWIDSSGKKQRLAANPGAYQTPRLSADGKRIALFIPDGPNQDVWVYDLQRDSITRLTFGGVNRNPVWSPDGQYIVFEKFGEGIFQARADGASPPQALIGNRSNLVPWSFTPDGKRLAYFDRAPRNQIWTVSLEDQGGQLKAGTPEQFLQSNFQDQAPSFSPDGHWLAYQSTESGKNEVVVRAFPSSGQGGKWQVSNNGGAAPRWSLSGHELVYQSGDQLMTASYTVKSDSFVAEKPRVWIATLGGTDWDLAPDGKRVAVLIPETAAAQAPQQEHEIVMLLNFADELRRRVPLGK